VALLTGSTLRVLGPRDLDEALSLLREDPVVNVFAASRILATRLVPSRYGGEVWGWYQRGRLTSLCYAGANLVPVNASEAAVEAFGDRASRLGRRCSSIVGSSEPVAQLWEMLEPSWGAAREVRPDQPVLVCDTPPRIAPDCDVRRVEPQEVPTLLPASIAMFTEEVGVSPLLGDGGALYRARVAELVAAGHAFARIDGDRVVFKAEIGSVAHGVCQVQGVWVRPELRGRGLSAPGMAAVVALAQRDVAPTVSLYVNEYNAPARAAYAKVGFRQVATFTSILF
jgi:predicted GNAT family acetyltransferase